MASLRALALFRSNCPAYRQGIERVAMYLAHFGVPYRALDLAYEALPGDLTAYPLIIASHADLDRRGALPGARFRAALEAGTGVVSFDPELSWRLAGAALPDTSPQRHLEIRITDAEHFVTRRHAGGEVLHAAAPLAGRALPGVALAEVGRAPLLSAMAIGAGQLLSWASTDWMDTRVLGPLAGLDDLFWRGLVWAARKPFCLRGLPPLVTMRVDDVAGTGGHWQQTPLYWARDAAHAGFKPWLGLFIYNLTPECVAELRGQIEAGAATAFPHAFGRPPRDAQPAAFFYAPNALNLRAAEGDEFIYFDHQRGVPWPDGEARRGLAAVDRWYADQGALPMARVALPHWYELGSNCVAHIRRAWGCDMIGASMGLDRPLARGVPWLALGPFRKYESPGDCHTFDPASRGGRPVYYADFLHVGGESFFNSLTEIRDDAGYEWTPNNAVAETAARGARQLRRALDSMAMASLFTHETDYIHKIRPDHWREIIEGVASGVSGYRPLYATLDDAMGILRATRTSVMTDVSLDSESDTITATFAGEADRPTSFYLFARPEEEGRLCDVSAFQGRVQVTTLS